MTASGGGGAQRRSGPAQWRTAVFLNRNPSRRRNIQTALCETSTRSQFVLQLVEHTRCGVWLIRSLMKVRCGSSTGLRCLPICRAPPSRSRDSAATTPPPRTPQRQNSAATVRQLPPSTTAATTRSRRSLERGRLHRMLAPSPASILNHKPTRRGILINSA